MNQNNNNERKNEQQNESQTRSTPIPEEQLTDQEQKKMGILRVKKDPAFKKMLKVMTSTEKKELKNKLQLEYGQDFGDLKMTPDEKEILKRYETKVAKRTEKKIKNIRHDLLNVPPEEMFEGFENAEEVEKKEERGDFSSPIFNLEQLRLRIANSLPEKLRAIFEEYFLVKLDTSNWSNPNTPSGQSRNDSLESAAGGALISKTKDHRSGKDKYLITVDMDCAIDTIYKELAGKQTKIVYFNEDKFLYLITRSILSTMGGKEEFEKFCRENGFNDKLDQNSADGSDDWLSYVLSGYRFGDKTYSDICDPKLKDMANQWLLQSSFIKPEENNISTPIIIKPEKINGKVWSDKATPWKDKVTGEPIRGWKRWLLEHNAPLGKLVYFATRAIPEIPSWLVNKEYYYMGLAERDGKAVNRLNSLDLSGGDYVKMIKESRFYNDKDRLRHLMLVIAGKGSYQWWMAQLWLWKFDPVFKSTKGKEISSDGFDFISRVTKAQAKATKGVFTPEYVRKGNRFVRFSYQNQIDKLDQILRRFSLRQIQQIDPDTYGNLLNDDTGEYMKLDAKLGNTMTTNFGENSKTAQGDKKDDKFFASSGVDIASIMSGGDASHFIKDMQEYSEKNHDTDFNNLVNPFVVSVTKRFLQSARTEREIFSMYTSPLISQGFDAYKNKVSEPSFIKDEYRKEFEEAEEDLEENNYDFEKVVENTPYDKLENIYNYFVKKESRQEYIRGTHLTRHGKLLEFIKQAKNRIKDVPGVSENVNDFIFTELEKIQKMPQVTLKDIERFHDLFEEKTANESPNAVIGLKKSINTFFGHLKNLNIIKQYEQLFKPYERVRNQYLSKKDNKKVDSKEKDNIMAHYFKEIASTASSAKDKIKDIENEFPDVNFTDKEKSDILSRPDEKARKVAIYLALEDKLVKKSSTGSEKLYRDFNDLLHLSQEINEILAQKDASTSVSSDILRQYRSLNLIPEEIKSKHPKSLRELQTSINLAKIVANDYYEEQQFKTNKRKQFGFDPEMEMEMEMQEEQAA